MYGLLSDYHRHYILHDDRRSSSAVARTSSALLLSKVEEKPTFLVAAVAKSSNLCQQTAVYMNGLEPANTVTNTYEYSMPTLMQNDDHFASEMVTKRVQDQASVTIRVDDTHCSVSKYNGSLKRNKRHQYDHIDPKLILTAQLFVQDLIARAKTEAHNKLASSERQVRKL